MYLVASLAIAASLVVNVAQTAFTTHGQSTGRHIVSRAPQKQFFVDKRSLQRLERRTPLPQVEEKQEIPATQKEPEGKSKADTNIRKANENRSQQYSFKYLEEGHHNEETSNSHPKGAIFTNPIFDGDSESPTHQWMEGQEGHEVILQTNPYYDGEEEKSQQEGREKLSETSLKKEAHKVAPPPRANPESRLDQPVRWKGFPAPKQKSSPRLTSKKSSSTIEVESPKSISRSTSQGSRKDNSQENSSRGGDPNIVRPVQAGPSLERSPQQLTQLSPQRPDLLPQPLQGAELDHSQSSHYGQQTGSRSHSRASENDAEVRHGGHRVHNEALQLRNRHSGFVSLRTRIEDNLIEILDHRPWRGLSWSTNPLLRSLSFVKIEHLACGVSIFLIVAAITEILVFLCLNQPGAGTAAALPDMAQITSPSGPTPEDTFQKLKLLSRNFKTTERFVFTTRSGPCKKDLDDKEKKGIVIYLTPRQASDSVSKERTGLKSPNDKEKKMENRPSVRNKSAGGAFKLKEAGTSKVKKEASSQIGRKLKGR